MSYFDEGVFSGGRLPANGLNAFDDRGQLVWQNDQTNRIDDCYALNVSDAGVWYCAYSDFDLCRVNDDGQTIAYRNNICGAPAFAIHADRVLFAFQYNEPPDTMYLATLSNGRLSKPKRTRIATEDGVEIPVHGLRMRGGFVHVFAKDIWYRGHLADISL